ncbi:MAG TPA: CcmD family protein [Bacteroidia bacterium]|jgi:CcmD family protein|nr:CcmD family protein [Bacteroidia bacterium]
MTKISHLLAMLLLFCATGLSAQNATAGNVEMADSFTSSGKIYVVVTVVLIILAGLLLYVISIDRKLTKLEKEIEKSGK